MKSHRSTTIVSGHCLRKILVDRIMNMRIFVRTLWDGYSVCFVLCAYSAEAYCGTHCVPVFAKKFCIVPEKSFKPKCNGFEVLKFTVTVKYFIWMLCWSCKLKKKERLTLRKVEMILWMICCYIVVSKCCLNPRDTQIFHTNTGFYNRLKDKNKGNLRFPDLKKVTKFTEKSRA